MSNGYPFVSGHHFILMAFCPATRHLPSVDLLDAHYKVASGLHLFSTEDYVAESWPRDSLSQYLLPAICSSALIHSEQ
jgi:hypothetical protein